MFKFILVNISVNDVQWNLPIGCAHNYELLDHLVKPAFLLFYNA